MRKTKRREKPFWQKVRVPLPRQSGGFHSSPKGRRGYLRSQAKRELMRLLGEELLEEHPEPEADTPESVSRNHSPES